MRILPNNEKYSRKYSLETRYNGIVFRSRLEARWAVYFDAIGAEYEYEPTGFELEGGIFYRPDFLVHLSYNRMQWCEVKGSFTDEDWKKIYAFAKEVEPLLLLGKMPGPPYWFTEICGYWHNDGRVEDNLILYNKDHGEYGPEYVCCSEGIYKMQDGSIQSAYDSDGVDVKIVRAAIKKATTYIFEQGENK